MSTPAEAYEISDGAENITSDQIAELLLDRAIRRNIMDYHTALDAVIAEFPQVKGAKQTVHANAWNIALRKWRKENGSRPREGGDETDTDGYGADAERMPNGCRRILPDTGRTPAVKRM